ncbi:MAG: DUF3473 domain-containing protein [Anaerolineales bacterium]|nr:DUF3473 domain-containing protein [Anaerolineales bacterium]
MLNALTVDLEDWFHGLTRTMFTPEHWSDLPARAELATAQLLQLFDQAGVKATFFVLGDLARRSPGLVAQIAEAGHELASHGFLHRLVHQLSPQEFRDDLELARQAIQQATGVTVKGFRAPQFSINQDSTWAFRVLAQAGYQYDSSVFPARSWLYGYAGAPRRPYAPLANSDLMEYPLATLRLGSIILPAAGGVYTRLLPYPILRGNIRRLNEQGWPAVLYLHPWELDLDQPRIPVNPRERLTHYGMRATLARKLCRLCQDFDWIPLGELHCSWALEKERVE